MQFSLRISALFIILLSLRAVDSRPKAFTLPLRRIQQRSDIHPQILLQMRINRGIRRLAKMTGAEPPWDRSLEQRLERRILSLDVPSGIDRRFNGVGVPRNVRESQLENRFNRAGVLKPRLKRQIPVTVANLPTAPDSLGLEIEGQDDGYLATVQIGTPSQNFTILVDSGSADFWVGGETCISEQGGGCGDHVLLGPQSSRTFTDTPKVFNITYGAGGVNGTIVQDNLVVGGLALMNHTFGVANQESIEFSSNNIPFDGVMGLAKFSLSRQQTPTPIEALASAGLVSAAIVSYKLGSVEDNDNDGEVTFGGLDLNKFELNTLVNLSNVNTEGFWESNLDGVSVNGVDLGLTDRTTILDTGTTFMLLPQSDAVLIHQNIPEARAYGQGGFLVPCTTNASVALKYGNNPFTIDPRDLVQGSGNESSYCMSSISGNTAATANASQWLLGDAFLKNVYFSTDVTSNTLSFAKLRSSSTSTCCPLKYIQQYLLCELLFSALTARSNALQSSNDNTYY